MKIILIGGGKSKNSQIIAKNILKYAKNDDIYFLPHALNPNHLSFNDNYASYNNIFEKIGFTRFKLINNLDNLNYKDKLVLYIGGGNTFRLSEIFMKHDFKSKILKENNILIGSSAGAIWLGKSIKYAHDRNENNLMNMNGANLIKEYIIFPHYDKIKHKIEIEKIIKNKEKIILIPENGALLFENEIIENIGEEKIIIFNSKKKVVLESKKIININDNFVDNKFLDIGKKAVMEGSNFLMKYYNSSIPEGFDIDKETELIIKKIILNNFPEHSFDGEETGKTENNSIYIWYCDPISSTNNLFSNLPHFAVCLSLFKDGIPIIGIVSDPVCNELYYAEIGKGAYLNGKKITPSSRKEIKKSNFSCSPKNDSQLMLKYLDEGGAHKMFGSWALHFAYVAAGKFDFCFTNLKDIHGTVPGLVIAKEAGCYIYDGKNSCWSINTKKILVTNTKELMEITKNDMLK